MQILDFLVRLGEDPALRQRFANDGASLVTESGFTLAECDALLSGDSSRIRTAAGFDCASLPPKGVSAPASRLRAA